MPFSHLPLDSEIRINEKEWRDCSDEQLQALEDVVFDNYRTRGFPYYRFTADQKRAELRKISEYDRRDLIEDGVIKQSMHGLALAWSYFDHSWAVRCGNMKSPMDVYDDDKLFRKAIRRRLKRGTFITDAGIRKALRSYTGAQAVSNFRPTAAAAIYDKYAGEGVVWDMSAGFGGRLLGALSCDRVKKYIGTDPATETYDGLCAMRRELLPLVHEQLFSADKEVELYKIGSEVYIPRKESLDLAFTSPPYFDTERYSHEPTQSWVKYPTRDSWSEGFLRQTMKNVYFGLKPEGYMVLNIADVKSHKNVTDDVLRIAFEEGFVLVDTLRLALSHISQGGFKYEPVYVFQKTENSQWSLF